MDKTAETSPDLQHTYRVDYFAKRVDVSSKTVRRWIDAGRIKAALVSPAVLRIPASELKRLGLLAGA